jgi:ribosomal protein S18 acetylase RimI-like enzyme
LPDGFRLRAVRGREEAEALAVLHRAAFDSDYLTTEKRLAWMDAPHYDPALDLVVVAPDGSLAASCFGLIDTAENERTGREEGALDPVAVHPKFQKRGLARACLLHGMQLLKKRGMEFAVLGTGGENVALQRAAGAAGFRIDSIRVWYAKAVAEHTDPAVQETDPASDPAR